MGCENNELVDSVTAGSDLETRANRLWRGAVVRIIRKESYWFNQTGVVAGFDERNGRFPVVVRFENVNYSGTNFNNFAFEELVLSGGQEDPTLDIDSDTDFGTDTGNPPIDGADDDDVAGDDNSNGSGDDGSGDDPADDDPVDCSAEDYDGGVSCV